MAETYNARTPDPSAFSPAQQAWLAREFQALQRQLRVSATDKLLGRSGTGGGPIEEITCTAAGRALLDDAAASNQRATLGLGTAAVEAYTEGTFTPSVTFGGASTGITYGTQVGSYVRIGKVVAVQIRVVLTAKGSSTGAMLITGLPATVWNDNAGYGVGAVDYANMAGLADGVVATALINTTTAALLYGGAAATTQLTEANFTDTSVFNASIIYRAA